MKKLVLATALTMVIASVQAMSLAEAKGKIGAVIDDPSEMAAVMKQLSAEDQKSFVAEVNGAIAKMPGSAEEKAAKANNVNRAAVKNAAKGNASALIAEVFATAPVESLALINETFAKDVLNRAADPKQTFTDDQFVKISKKVMKDVNSRLAGSEDAGVRGAFAVLTLVRASNGSPASLANELADTLGDNAATAKNEWLPAALSNPANYDPMLSGTDVEKAPDIKLALNIAGPQRHFVLLSAVIAGASDPLAAADDGFGDLSQNQTVDGGIYTLPRSTEQVPWNPDIPRGYNWQNFGR